MWVCRAGQKTKYLDYYLECSKIYLPWSTCNVNLDTFDTFQEYKALISKEMNTENRTSISNWACQLEFFCKEIKIGDYVVLPHYRSHFYTLVQVLSNYEYEETNDYDLHHSRKIKIIKNAVPSSCFSQTMIYSMGAFRTVFKVKNETELLKVFMNWKN